MVAIAYTDAYTDVRPDAYTKAHPGADAPAVRARSAAKKQGVATFVPPSDPVVDMFTRLLTVPLHQMYALLWRVGVLSVDE